MSKISKNTFLREETESNVSRQSDYILEEEFGQFGKKSSGINTFVCKDQQSDQFFRHIQSIQEWKENVNRRKKITTQLNSERTQASDVRNNQDQEPFKVYQFRQRHKQNYPEFINSSNYIKLAIDKRQSETRKLLQKSQFMNLELKQETENLRAQLFELRNVGIELQKTKIYVRKLQRNITQQLQIGQQISLEKQSLALELEQANKEKVKLGEQNESLYVKLGGLLQQIEQTLFQKSLIEDQLCQYKKKSGQQLKSLENQALQKSKQLTKLYQKNEDNQQQIQQLIDKINDLQQNHIFEVQKLIQGKAKQKNLSNKLIQQLQSLKQQNKLFEIEQLKKIKTDNEVLAACSDSYSPKGWIEEKIKYQYTIHLLKNQIESIKSTLQFQENNKKEKSNTQTQTDQLDAVGNKLGTIGELNKIIQTQAKRIVFLQEFIDQLKTSLDLHKRWGEKRFDQLLKQQSSSYESLDKKFDQILRRIKSEEDKTNIQYTIS